MSGNNELSFWHDMTDEQVRLILRDHDKELRSLAENYSLMTHELTKISRRLSQILWIAAGILFGVIASQVGLLDAIKLVH